MRKAQKRQAEDFVKLLGQAHGEIRKAIEKRNISTALSLLADCQDGAIALGDLIEKADGEGAPTIPILESYCEQVYEIHEELKKGQPVGAGRVFKSLRQMLFKIENSVKHDIRLRKEAVFLPYKASMWDSLESIWKAADEDPDCDAYVIPIPYYDKNPDGSFKELHYEGGEYPKSVPVIWYEDYDFQKRRPDMIFIHNPYDECNLVTSVHPFFYARNLKQFTDKLVYVPYFILGEVDPANKKALEGLCKFCLVPGVICADQVIVQSENMRQAYINVLTESLSSQGRNREYWKKKIDGSGSPKVDKVLSTEKEDLEIPEEWMKVIRKPDGSWKKIVFYNTTVTALLQHNEKYLAKLREVLQIFYENRDQVALLWRPHPLFVATIESMRPELKEQYREILEWFRKEGWGIYDDTADMDRAVYLSDTYYGDESSVMHLYKKTTKPVMAQNLCFVRENDNTKNFYFSSIAEDGDTIYFVCRVLGLVVCNKHNGLVKRIVPVPDEEIPYGYSDLVIDNNRVFMLPGTAREIAFYSMTDQKMHKISLGRYEKKSINQNTPQIKFQKFILMEKKLFMIPLTYEWLLELDIEDEIPHITDGWDVSLLGGIKGCGANRENKMIYLLCERQIIQIDVHHNTKAKIQLACDYNAIAVGGNCIWLAEEKYIDCYNLCFTLKRRIDLSEKGIGLISKCVFFKDMLFSSAWNSGTVLMWNAKKDEMEEIKLPMTDNNLLEFEEMSLCILGTELWIGSSQKNCIYAMDLESKVLRKKYIRYKNSLKGYLNTLETVNSVDEKREGLYPEYVLENMVLSLSGNHFSYKDINELSNFGKKIYLSCND